MDETKPSYTLALEFKDQHSSESLLTKDQS